MANTAILVGNSRYRTLTELACCHDDLLAINELLEASEKYNQIEVIENTDADDLKSRIRAAIDILPPPGELFFYFTGHGFQHENEFYYCATNFDPKRPNETGLSTTELHTLLRLADAELVVKIIDACNSGTLLVKAEGGFASEEKHGFKSLIQISSCLESQNSLTGKPLSVFTKSFRTAALRKTEGVVYYTDIIFALRDEFLENNDQTPFFVSQGTGRDQFINDAKRFDVLRAKLTEMLPAARSPASEVQPILPAVPTLEALLQNAELAVATPEQVPSFINTFFDNLIEKFSTCEFSKFFEMGFSEHANFTEPTARAFIIRVLSKESRPDNFVTARISRERRRNPLSAAAAVAMLGVWGRDTEWLEVYDLDLNCVMQRAQLRIMLKPEYHSLKQLVLVVTCAPSLEKCYIFEIGTQHRLIDFGKFDPEGDEIVRRWYKCRWAENTDGLVAKIVARVDELVREHLESTEQRLIRQERSE